MNAPIKRRSLLLAGTAALGVAALSVGTTMSLAAEVLNTPPSATRPSAFDPAAFVADIITAGYGISAYYDVPFCGEPAGPPGFLIRPPKGQGFDTAYTAVMAKWRDAMEACPDHVEQVVAHVFEPSRKAAA